MVIDCDTCAMHDTDTCADCVVSFFISADPGEALVVDLAEMRATPPPRRGWARSAPSPPCHDGEVSDDLQTAGPRVLPRHYVDELIDVARAGGLDAVGICRATPFLDARRALEDAQGTAACTAGCNSPTATRAVRPIRRSLSAVRSR